MANQKITALTNYTNPDPVQDVIPIVDTANQQTKKITRNNLLGITSAPLGLTDTQSVQNKTFDNTNTVTLKASLFTLQDQTDTTKQAKFDLSAITTGTTRTYTLPNVSDTLVSLTASQTLTNKTLTSPTINTPTITNATLSADAITGFSVSNNGTIYGIAVTGGQIGSAALATGAVTATKIGTDASFSWVSWTPAYINLTVGNATNVGYYAQIGKIVHVKTTLTLGSTSSVASNPALTLPITASSNGMIGSGTILGVSFLQANYGVVRYSSTTSVDFPVWNVAGTYLVLNGVTSTVPVTWTTGNQIALYFNYEAA